MPVMEACCSVSRGATGRVMRIPPPVERSTDNRLPTITSQPQPTLTLQSTLVPAGMRGWSMRFSNRKLAAVLAASTLAAPPALADKKLDEAIARAEQQLQRGHPEEGVKSLQRLADQTANAEAYAALARFQWKTGDAEGAGRSSARAVEL